MVRDSRLRACLFLVKSYNAHVRVTQKDACFTLVLFDRIRSTRAAKPCVRQSRHPANSLKWTRLLRPPMLVRYRIRISVCVSSRFSFSLRSIVLRTCLLDARVSGALAMYARVAGVTGLRRFVRRSVYADELQIPHFVRDDKPLESADDRI